MPGTSGMTRKKTLGGRSFLDVPASAVLAWIMPGLGHLYLGHRVRGWIFLATITLTYWTGIAVGGVHGTIDPKEHPWWFVAQLCNGGHTSAAYLLRSTLEPAEFVTVTPAAHYGPRPVKPLVHYGHWLSIEIGTVYTAVAGLLNILVILDAIVRADAALRAAPRGVRAGAPWSPG